MVATKSGRRSNSASESQAEAGETSSEAVATSSKSQEEPSTSKDTNSQSDEVGKVEAGVKKNFESLCTDLNMDSSTKTVAWESYQQIRQNYTLEV